MSVTFLQSNGNQSPCLPVSKGSIKKPAETRFVNSSPRSYRLMPASVESSDMTSFVEKSSHPNQTPMKVMLEVAELWKLSKRSELECNFTLAKSKLLFDTDYYIEEASRRSPICHPAIIPCPVIKRVKRQKWNVVDDIKFSRTRRERSASVKTIFKLQDRFPLGAAGIIRRQVDEGDTLMKNFFDKMRDTDNDTIDSNPGNISLAPLVKRLSVSGLCDNEAGFKENCSNPGTEKSQTSKRPMSVTADHEEAPVNKRALCNNNMQQLSVHPG